MEFMLSIDDLQKKVKELEAKLEAVEIATQKNETNVVNCKVSNIKTKMELTNQFKLYEKNTSILRKFFMSWREQVMSEERLNDLYDEFLLERNWAYKNNFESEYWCWTCKFGKDCQFH